MAPSRFARELRVLDPRPNATFECTVDGGPWEACSSPLTLELPGDGDHAFAVRAIASGLADTTPPTATWHLDATAPTTTITVQPPALTTSRSISIDVTGADAGGGAIALECSLDGAPYAACAAPVQFDDLADGSHELRIRTIDAAGNADPSPAVAAWMVDATAPTTTVTNPPLRRRTWRDLALDVQVDDGAGSGAPCLRATWTAPAGRRAPRRCS